MPSFNITRAAHTEFRVTDLGRARAFYVDALGFVEVDRDAERLYLGGLEERDKYCLVLRQAASAGVGHIAFRVAAPEDLEALAALHAERDRPVRWIEGGALERGQGRALRVQDPSGLPLEFFCEIEQRERLLQRFDLYRGAHIMRLDHFNCQVPDVQAAYDWWTRQLGFFCSEYTVADPPAGPGPHPAHHWAAAPPGAEPYDRLWAAWLHRKQNVHDLALMNGIGPRLHHAAFWLQDTQSVLRACDILAALGQAAAIERGPGRHGLSNAFFLYLRDPDGNRIELYTSDYLIPDPDFKPIRWTLSDPRRATFWGQYAPRSWFDEAALVEDVHTGRLLPTTEPHMAGRPDFVT
jgi:catechol 2,3-dioxygenase-like lactoylglutathione lyase family enzyme